MKHILILIALCLPVLHCRATVLTNTYALAEGESLDQESWILAKKRVDIRGTVNKDLFIQAENCDLQGEMKEDVWGAAMQHFEFSGHAKDDLRVFAMKSIRANGRVDGDLHAIALQLLQLSTNSVVAGDVTLKGNEVMVLGEVHGDLNVTASKLTLKATVKGDVIIDSDDIAILPETVIEGNLNTRSAHEYHVDSKVTVNGEISHDVISRNYAREALFWRSRFFVWAILAGLPLCFWFPLFTDHCISKMKANRFRCFWIGMGLTFCTAVTGILLVGSQVGIALAFVTVGFLGILLYLTKIVFAVGMGLWLLRNVPNQSPMTRLLAMCLGLLVFYSITAIPQLGGAIWMVIAFTGLGAMVLTLFESQFRKPEPPQPPELSESPEQA